MKLYEICEYSTKRIEAESLGVENYISTENMLQNKGGVVTAAKLPAEKAVAFNPGDVLISNIRPYFKKIWLADKCGGCSSDVLCLSALSGIDTTYLYYLLSQDSFFEYVMSGAKGSKMPRGDKAQIMNWEVDVPDIAEQKRIGGFLKSIDDKISLNTRINHNLEEQAQTLYKSWFVDFAPFKNGKFVESELGIIPEGWRIGTLSDLGDIVAGGTPSKAKPEYYTNNGIAWLTPKDLSVKCNKFTARGETDITEEGYKNSSAKLIPRGSVLFSSRAPIGYISIAKKNVCTNQGFKSVVPMYAGTAYIYYWLHDNTEAIESQASGSTFKEASGSLMKSFPVIVPEKGVLDSFEKELAPILNEQEILEEEIYHAEQIRDSLLPRLMSGELVLNC